MLHENEEKRWSIDKCLAEWENIVPKLKSSEALKGILENEISEEVHKDHDNTKAECYAEREIQDFIRTVTNQRNDITGMRLLMIIRISQMNFYRRHTLSYELLLQSCMTG